MTITYQLSFIVVSSYISCYQVFECNIKNTVTLKTHVGFRLMAIDRFDKYKLCINKVYQFNFEFQCDRSSPNFFSISILTVQTKERNNYCHSPRCKHPVHHFVQTLY